MGNLVIGPFIVLVWALAFICDGCMNPPIGEDISDQFADIREAYGSRMANPPVLAMPEAELECDGEAAGCTVWSGTEPAWIALANDSKYYTLRMLAVHEYGHVYAGHGHGPIWLEACTRVAKQVHVNEHAACTP